MAVHLALLELGVEHRLEKLDLAAGAQHSPGYRRLDPRGQVPTLIIDDKAYFGVGGAAAVAGRASPGSGSRAAPGRSQRPEYYQWMVFLTNSLGSPYRLWFCRMTSVPKKGHPVRDAIRQKIEDGWSILDAHLEANGPYMLGAEISVVDLLAIMYMRWSRNMPKPATAWPALNRFAASMRQRPSWKEALCDGGTDGVG